MLGKVSDVLKVGVLFASLVSSTVHSGNVDVFTDFGTTPDQLDGMTIQQAVILNREGAGISRVIGDALKSVELPTPEQQELIRKMNQLFVDKSISSAKDLSDSLLEWCTDKRGVILTSQHYIMKDGQYSPISNAFNEVDNETKQSYCITETSKYTIRMFYNVLKNTWYAKCYNDEYDTGWVDANQSTSMALGQFLSKQIMYNTVPATLEEFLNTLTLEECEVEHTPLENAYRIKATCGKQLTDKSSFEDPVSTELEFMYMEDAMTMYITYNLPKNETADVEVYAYTLEREDECVGVEPGNEVLVCEPVSNLEDMYVNLGGKL